MWLELYRSRLLSRLVSTQFRTRSALSRLHAVQTRCLCSKSNSNEPEIQKGVATKYKLFTDEDATVILDVDEERLLHEHKLADLHQEVVDEFAGINLTRGTSGVYEIKDLIDVLSKDKAKDVFVVKVPPELGYVDYFVVVSGLSTRHILGLAEFVRRVYKKKMHPSDSIPSIEGNHPDSYWVALDLGNIALHIMTPEARTYYDLESLWALGPKLDLKQDDSSSAFDDFLKRHSLNLDDFKPLSENKS